MYAIRSMSCVFVNSCWIFLYDVGVFFPIFSNDIVIGTMRSNRVGLPTMLVDTQRWRIAEQGHFEWTMHTSRGMSCSMWKDKCPILL